MNLPALRMVRKRMFIGFCAVIGLLVLAGCERVASERPAPPPAEVETYTTELLTVPVGYEYVGQTEASQDVDVRARVEGVVWEIGFEEGSSVEPGQFLFRIDPRPFEADLQIAEAQEFQSKVQVQSAERDLNRTRRLQESASVSREELDNAISEYETAVASQRLSEANVLKARLELSYTTVTAPIAGMVGQALKKPGDLVDSSQNSLLCNITAQDPMYVNFTVAEKDLLQQRNAEQDGRIVAPDNDEYEVEITLLDGSRYGHIGRINYADVTIDTRTGTGMIRAAFPNPDGILKPGQFAEVLVKGARRTNTIVVPQKAVMLGMQGTYVYVVDDEETVEMRPVNATVWEGHNWVVESGLREGERVIIAGTNKTQPGAEVAVTTQTTTLVLDTTSGRSPESRMNNAANAGASNTGSQLGASQSQDQTLPRTTPAPEQNDSETTESEAADS